MLNTLAALFNNIIRFTNVAKHLEDLAYFFFSIYNYIYSILLTEPNTWQVWG